MDYIYYEKKKKITWIWVSLIACVPLIGASALIFSISCEKSLIFSISVVKSSSGLVGAILLFELLLFLLLALAEILTSFKDASIAFLNCSSSSSLFSGSSSAVNVLDLLWLVDEVVVVVDGFGASLRESSIARLMSSSSLLETGSLRS